MVGPAGTPRRSDRQSWRARAKPALQSLGFRRRSRASFHGRRTSAPEGPSALTAVLVPPTHAMFLRKVVEVLSIHLRFAGGRADVAVVTPEKPFHITPLELRLEARARVAVAAACLEAVEVGAAIGRGGKGDQIDLVLAGRPRHV